MFFRKRILQSGEGKIYLPKNNRRVNKLFSVFEAVAFGVGLAAGLSRGISYHNAAELATVGAIVSAVSYIAFDA